MAAREKLLNEESVPADSLLTPVTIEDRTHLIDVVRGFALFGVLLGNMVWLSQEVALTSQQIAELPTAGIDQISRYLVQFFVDGKFVTLFAFLFGMGFSVQLMRAEARGAPIIPAYIRRMVILLAFGILHAYLLWYGDILVFYALLGFVLILFRYRSDRTLLIWGVATAVAVPVLVLMLKSGIGIINPVDPAAAAAAAAQDVQIKAERLAAFTTGSYFDVFPENAKINASFWLGGVCLFALPHIFGKFLFGFYAGRRRLLQDAAGHLVIYRRLLWWGLAIGLIANSAWVLIKVLADSKIIEGSSPLVIGSPIPEYIGMLGLAGFYLSALVLLFQRPAWRKTLLLLAPVGRMALTNYLMQSAINLFIFYGFGLGLMGKIGSTYCILISIAAFAFQIVFSNWWLKRFRFGPMEWLWRSLTYGKLQPMQIA